MRIIVGISGGIAAYKAPMLVRLLKKNGHDVQCVATSHALQFVTPLTLQTVSGHAVYSDLFAESNDFSTEHIALKDWADAIVVAPATANIIAKMAAGVADDALSTTLLSMAGKRRFVCPAMNSDMLHAPATQRNIEQLRADGVTIIESAVGELACGCVGDGRMAEPEEIYSRLISSMEAPLAGKKVLITAGPTYERIDAVRFVGNFSSGKMGYALAEVMAEQGAEVVLVSGPTHLTTRHSGIRRIDVESARQMYSAAVETFPSCDAAVLCAAVADYRPEHCADHKLKKNGNEGLTIEMVQNPDILATLGKMKREGQTLVGFALETNDERANAKSKLERKNLDMIVLNSLRDKGAGFGVDTNKVLIIKRDGSEVEGELKSKRAVAEDIVRELKLK